MMKKIITHSLFIIALVFGFQTINAQSVTPEMIKINGEASKKAKELRQFVKFDEDTHEKAYLAFQEHGNKIESLKINSANGNFEKDKAKADALLEEKLKTLFTPEENDRYDAFKETSE